MRVLKGHGTENDFVIVPDLDGVLELSPRLVAAICDRRAGLGADGVLRVVRSANDPDSAPMAAGAQFFMDYRNADGSVAEMCGNGVRVFVRYLQRAGLVGQSAAVATRGGIKQVWAVDGALAVGMGSPVIHADRPVATAAPALRAAGVAVALPNPHVVVEVGTLAELAALDLTRAPVVEPAGADGQNVEFVVRTGPRRLRMRVHERGVGETRSCGTGICAAVVATASAADVARDGGTWIVDVPGGTCAVRWGADDRLDLTGPAEIVAEIELDDDWLGSIEPQAAVAIEPQMAVPAVSR